MPNINKIKLSGTSYDIQDANATKTVELTQAQYDALVTGGTVDSNTFYVITDGEMFNPSGKVDTSAFTEFSGSVETALGGKQDTLSAGTNITIVDNVISAEGGGGKAISAGTNISVTTGETADTINCTLPITTAIDNTSLNFGFNTINSEVSYSFGNANTVGRSRYNGSYSMAVGLANIADGGEAQFVTGYNNRLLNVHEFGSGQFNNSVSESTTFGDSGNTLFSVGNGTADNARHNAFEIRQNGDIYIADTNDTSTSNYYQKPMIKLQDALGGGGIDSGTVQTMIDESISGKTDESAFTAHTADTTIHVTTAQTAAWNAKSDFSGSYNDLTDKPTIPTVPTSNTAFTNDAQYATSGYVDSAVSGKANSSDVYTKSQTSGATEISTALATKQDTLVSGTNIKTINNESILGEGNITIEGGSSINVVQTTGTSTADVMSQNAVTVTKLDNVRVEPKTPTSNYTQLNLYLQKGNGGAQSLFTYVKTINGKSITSQNNNNLEGFSLIETSAITTSISSSSTDAQVPSAKAVNDKLGGLSLVKLTQAEYDALATKDSNTLYVING